MTADLLSSICASASAWLCLVSFLISVNCECPKSAHWLHMSSYMSIENNVTLVRL